MNKLILFTSAIILVSTSGFARETKKADDHSAQNSNEEMDIISMSQSADEFVPAPDRESFLDKDELYILRQESPVQWDVQTGGKPLEIPNFMKTALDSDE